MTVTSLELGPIAVLAPIAVHWPGQSCQVHGQHGAFNSAEVRRALFAQIALGEGDFLLSVNDVELRDGTFLGVLASAYLFALAKGRRLVLTSVSAQMETLLGTFQVGRQLLGFRSAHGPSSW